MLWIALTIGLFTSWALLSLLGNERQRKLNELQVKAYIAARNSKQQQ